MPDLIDDGTWREAALARMSEVFVTNRGLRPMYLLMASAHRYAIDYIEQAPVIVLAAARGNADVSRTERAFIQEQFRKMCQSKARLRDVMHSYGLPLPLRLLDGRVLTASRATAIRRLALMNPSTLAQIIPATRQKQNAWLQALQNWCEGMAFSSEANDYRCLFFEWAATNFPGVTYTEANGVRHIIDFVIDHPDIFNPVWTLERARAEEQKWHADLAVAEVVERTGVPLGKRERHRLLRKTWRSARIWLAVPPGTPELPLIDAIGPLAGDSVTGQHCIARLLVRHARGVAFVHEAEAIAAATLVPRPAVAIRFL